MDINITLFLLLKKSYKITSIDRLKGIHNILKYVGIPFHTIIDITNITADNNKFALPINEIEFNLTTLPIE
jgi:hypothetical protein